MRKLSNKRINVSAIRVSKYHWKREVSDASVEKLADDMELLGHLHPIIVRPVGNAGNMYELLAGEHRLRALIKIGEKAVDCRVVKCNDKTAELISLSENLRISTPTSKEWEQGVVRYVQLLEEEYSKELETMKKMKGEFCEPGSQNTKKAGRPSTPRSKAVQETAKASGVSDTTVYNALKRNENLVSVAAQALERGRITKQQANQLAKMPGKKQVPELAKMMRETREATTDRLARERAATASDKTKEAKKIVASLISKSESLEDAAINALSYMDGADIDYKQILDMDVDKISKCATALQNLIDFLES